MNVKAFASIIILMLLPACASQPALVKPTASGHAEGLFVGLDITSVQAKLLDVCTRGGLQLYETTTSQVTCGKTTEGGRAIYSQLLIGNSYSTTPVEKLQFVMFPTAEGVKVVAYHWIETQMALGQVRRLDLNGNAERNELQKMFSNLGAE